MRLALLLALLCASSTVNAAVHPVASGADLLRLQTASPTGRIVVKLHDGAVNEAANLCSSNPAPSRLKALMARLAPGAKPERRFRLPAETLDALRQTAEARSRKDLPDLNAYLVLDLRTRDRKHLLSILSVLTADPSVETAFLESVVLPFSQGPAPFAGEAPGTRSTAPLSPAVSPDFSGLQGFRGSAPTGVGATDVLGIPGADGSGVKIIDVEYAWLWTHEDLTTPFAELGAQSPVLSHRLHGTSVMGVIRGSDNGFGVLGLAPASAVGGASIAEQSSAEAILSAIPALGPGDLILIEVAGIGPNYTGSGWIGTVPLEFYQDVFDAIELATSLGIIVCEPAANGEEDLDDPIYAGLFDRNQRDSGAIFCGASFFSSLDPASWTNHGTRLDVHAWGAGVVTCGGNGELQAGPEEEWYTDTFNGTSAAGAILAGAVASLQGMVKSAFGFPMDSWLMRSVLNQTGTPQNPGPLIGPRPDLAAAWTLVSGGIGAVAGTVTEAGSGTPIEGVRVEVLSTGAIGSTSGAGDYALPLLTGSYTLRFTSFFHQTTDIPVSVLHDSTLTINVVLNRKATADLVARTWSRDGYNLLPGVRVTPLASPLPGGRTGANGAFDIGSVPGGTYRLLFDGLPGYGVAYREFTLAWEGPPPSPIEIPGLLPTVDEDFETGDGGFQATGLWTHGTPQAGGPTGGFSGAQCWGVGMTGDYPDDADEYLFSPLYNFGNPAPTSLFLSFHYWSETENNFDGVTLEHRVSASFGIWSVQQPLEDYTHNNLYGLDGSPGWSGSTGEWRGAVFDLTSYIASNMQFRLRFGSDFGVAGDGFWIDDIAFDTGGSVTRTPRQEVLPGVPVLAAFPNPSSGSTTIAWRNAVSGRIRLDILDVQGRRLGTLIDGPAAASGSYRWNGTDGMGRPLPAGVYWLALNDPEGREAVRKVTRAR